ncbi:hypothetical protein AB0A12_04450 [Streptomyces virginiae]|nr:hypothetical protein [Streptomyces virginiae]
MTTPTAGSSWCNRATADSPYRGGFRVTAVLPHQAPARAAGSDRTGTDTATGTGAGTGPDSGTGTGTGAGAAAPLESARLLADVRRAARRRSVAAPAAPLAAAAVFVPAALYLAWQLTTSVQPPSRFGELETGRSRAELARLLPPRPYPHPPDRARAAPRPPGSACEFYRSAGDLLGQVDPYRLCWAGDTLVAKDTVPASRM